MFFIFSICFCCLIYLRKSWIQKTNKWISPSSCCNQMHHCRHHRGTLLQRCPEAGGRSAGRYELKLMDRWISERVLEIITDSSWRNSRTGDRVANSTFCSVGSSTLALASLILSAFTPPHPSPLLSSFKEDWSLFQTIHPSSGSGTRGTQGNVGSWTDFRGGKSYHNSPGTLIRFK